jgi:hypothetical protein
MPKAVNATKAAEKPIVKETQAEKKAPAKKPGRPKKKA